MSYDYKHIVVNTQDITYVQNMKTTTRLAKMGINEKILIQDTNDDVCLGSIGMSLAILLCYSNDGCNEKQLTASTKRINQTNRKMNRLKSYNNSHL